MTVNKEIKKPLPPDTSDEAIDKLIDRADSLIDKCKERLEKDNEQE